MRDILSREEILKYSQCGLSKESIIVLDTVDSTNLYCRELAASKPRNKTLVIADTQTMGRGRMGRKFFSPQSTGIYMSLLLNCNMIKLDINLLTVAAGVAVCRVLKNYCRIDASIKWVNDIFANGKKVCGILAESVSDANTNSHIYIIVGIGINISTPENIFPDELKSIAGSVYPIGITRNEIIARITNEFHGIYKKNDAAELIREYKIYSLVLGKEISFNQNGKAYTGTATDINEDGNLICHLKNGEIFTLKSGEVSLGSNCFVKTI